MNATRLLLQFKSHNYIVPSDHRLLPRETIEESSRYSISDTITNSLEDLYLVFLALPTLRTPSKACAISLHPILFCVEKKVATVS